MNRLVQKRQNHTRRKNRVRTVVSGTSDRPRLSVSISNRNITAQLIDDTRHITVVYCTTVGSKAVTGNMTERATKLGEQVAQKAKAAKIKSVVFDRNGRLYHGRVKALADAARQGGLEF